MRRSARWTGRLRHLTFEGRLRCRPLRASAAAFLLLCVPIVFAPAAGANQKQRTICCRSSGGTRGTCLNLWAHLVPVSNRFDPGPSRMIALLQGPSPNGETMRVQLSRPAGQLLVDQILPAQRAAVWLLTLPKPDRAEVSLPLLWESFPTCRPNRPPSRTLLETGPTAKASTHSSPLSALLGLCGKEVATAPLLRDFGMEEWISTLPAALPVHCQVLKVGSGALPQPPENEARP